MDSLDWDTFLKRFEEKEGDNYLKKTRKTSWIRPVSVAAGFLLIIGLFAWFWLNRTQINVYQTGFGETQEIVLNDNSKVKLNGNTKLTWDKNWERREIRTIEIEGEAFFDVAHNEEIPFQVVTPDLTVNVTGTTFNVTNRRNQTDVFLESGKVRLLLNPKGDIEETLSPGGEVGSKNELADRNEIIPSVVEMVPGDLLSYSSIKNKIIQKKNTTTKESASWKTGSLIYEDMELDIVLKELNDVYGKTFEVQDSSLLDMKVDVSVPSSDWETVVGLMKFMVDAEFLEENEKVIIK
nr:FecR domain-containing protein [Membranihabitans maritimus]